MKSIFEKLQDYFNNTAEEKIKSDWSLTSKLDEINSPSIENFIDNCNYFIKLEDSPPDLGQNNFVNNFKNPNFTSDFFLSLIYGKSEFFT